MRRLFSAVLALLFVASPVFAGLKPDPADIARWSDSYFTDALAHRRMSGAMITVTQHGRVIFQKGYGYEDARRGILADPRSTRIRICSNSKTITATAVLQLVDRGRIRSLEDPVNLYLTRFQLQSPYPGTIRIRDLLTHRTGFGASFFNEGTLRPVALSVSGSVYEQLLARFTNPPGTVSVYANSALAVQGALIEDVSGLPFAEYVRRNIFLPLGMKDSEIHASPERPRGLATPWRYYPDGSMERVPFVAKHPAFAPSGGVVTTVADMAKFVSAQADEGRTTLNPLLTPATFRRMHSQQVTNHPGLPGFGLQYFTDRIGSERLAWHDCFLPGFNSAQDIYPDSDIGVFISVLSSLLAPRFGEETLAPYVKTRMTPSSDGLWQPRLTATTAILDFRRDALHLVHAPDVPLPRSLAHPSSDYVGRYVDDGRPSGTLLDLFPVFDDAIATVREDPKGGLQIMGDGPFHEIAPDVFAPAISGDRYAFRRNPDGRVEKLVSQATAFSRVAFIDDPRNAVRLFWIWFALSLSILPALRWPARDRPDRIGVILPALVGVGFTGILTTLLWPYHVAEIESMVDYIDAGLSTRLIIVAVGFNLIAILALIIPIFAIRAVRARRWDSRRRRTHYAMIALIGLLAWPFLLLHHLIGLQLP